MAKDLLYSTLNVLSTTKTFQNINPVAFPAIGGRHKTVYY